MSLPGDSVAAFQDSWPVPGSWGYGSRPPRAAYDTAAQDTVLPYACKMYAVIETDIFVRVTALVWTRVERLAFCERP